MRWSERGSGHWSKFVLALEVQGAMAQQPLVWSQVTRKVMQPNSLGYSEAYQVPSGAGMAEEAFLGNG